MLFMAVCDKAFAPDECGLPGYQRVESLIYPPAWDNADRRDEQQRICTSGMNCLLLRPRRRDTYLHALVMELGEAPWFGMWANELP